MIIYVLYGERKNAVSVSVGRIYNGLIVLIVLLYVTDALRWLDSQEDLLLENQT